MSNTIIPTTVVALINRVKIEKNLRTGLYVLRSVELGNMAVAVSRAVLRKIADRRNWRVVKSWSVA